MVKYKSFAISMPPELYEALKEEANRKGLPLSRYITQICMERNQQDYSLDKIREIVKVVNQLQSELTGLREAWRAKFGVDPPAKNLGRQSLQA